MESTYAKITRFMEAGRASKEQAKKAEKKQVYVNPDSYIGREIEYQTALLHEIKQEVDDLRAAIATIKRNN